MNNCYKSITQSKENVNKCLLISTIVDGCSQLLTVSLCIKKYQPFVNTCKYRIKHEKKLTAEAELAVEWKFISALKNYWMYEYMADSIFMTYYFTKKYC